MEPETRKSKASFGNIMSTTKINKSRASLSNVKAEGGVSIEDQFFRSLIRPIVGQKPPFIVVPSAPPGSAVYAFAFWHPIEKSMSRVKVRRQSYGFSGVPGIRPVERTSQLGLEFKRPPLVYLPTYQLDPYVTFDPAKVRDAINELLDIHFMGHKYNLQDSPALVLRLASEIMRKVKVMGFNRYRIISVVTMGQKRAQSYNNAITFLWDHERDNYVDVQREVTTAFIQITVFGVYLD